jgi:hypothetical protein
MASRPPPDHGQDPVRHRCGHGEREDNAAQVLRRWAAARWTVNTPVLNDPKSQKARALLKKIETIRKLIGHTPKAFGAQPPTFSPKTGDTTGWWRLALGRGPAAGEIVGRVARRLSAAIAVVQHVDENFAVSLAAWLRTTRRCACGWRRR